MPGPRTDGTAHARSSSPLAAHLAFSDLELSGDHQKPLQPSWGPGGLRARPRTIGGARGQLEQGANRAAGICEERWLGYQAVGDRPAAIRGTPPHAIGAERAERRPPDRARRITGRLGVYHLRNWARFQYAALRCRSAGNR